MRKTRVDKLGRIVIPKKMRDKLKITSSTELIIEHHQDGIIIIPLEKICALCGNMLEDSRSLPLCDKCIERVKNI